MGGGSKVFFRPLMHPSPIVGTLFLMMIECFFKVDGQIETVHVCNLTRLVYFNDASITLHMTY